MSQVLTLALNGFKESRRNRVTTVVFLFAFVIIFSATFSLELTVATFERVLTDVGLGVMSLIVVFISIFLSSALIPREIERRTVFLIVSKPVSRAAFVVGRLLGNLLTVAFLVAIMASLLVLQVWWDGTPVRPSLLAGVYGIFLEAVLMSCVGFAVASRSSQFVTAIITTGLFFIGHLSTDLYRYASKAEAMLGKVIGLTLYYALPNLERLDFKQRATYAEPTTLGELALATAYTLGYSVVMVVLAAALFEKRDFK